MSDCQPVAANWKSPKAMLRPPMRPAKSVGVLLLVLTAIYSFVWIWRGDMQRINEWKWNASLIASAHIPSPPPTTALSASQSLTEPTAQPADDNAPIVLLHFGRVFQPKNLNFSQFYFRDLNCPAKCRYTYDRERWNEAAAVIISHVWPFDSPYPPHANPEQRIVVTLSEAAGRSAMVKLLKKVPPHYVNLTAGPGRYFDIFSPYDSMVEKKPTEKELQRIDAVLSAKSKPAFIAYSHCVTDSKREKLVSALNRYFPVDSFGNCPHHSCDKECLNNNLRDYHFYLAFENNVCDDYVTEKAFRLKDLILPVVIRAEDCHGQLPDGSYVAADQFQTVQQLAAHLRYLASNSTAYKEYFAWTRKYSLKHESSRPQQLCAVCQNLHVKTFRHSYADLTEFHGPKKRCDNELVPRLLRESRKRNATTGR